MQRLQAAEAVLRKLSGGDINPSGGGVLMADILLILEPIRAKLIYNFYFVERNIEGDLTIDDGFIDTFDQPVLFDNARELYYSELPIAPIELPRNLGIYMIAPLKDQFNQYIPMRNGFSALMNGLESNTLLGFKGYYQEGQRVYYRNVNASNAPDSVLMKIIGVNNLNLKDNSVIKVPKSMELDLIDMCYKHLLDQKIQNIDKVNDNAQN